MPQIFSLEERLNYLRQHGSHSLAYSTLQPRMKYFDLPGVGYLGYMQYLGTRYVLSDPIADKSKKAREELVKAALKEHPATCFVQTYEPFTRMLHERFGFYGTQMGIETWIDLDNWSLKGEKRQILRTARNQAIKNEISITESSSKQGGKDISEQWFKSRKVKSREVVFLIRPMDMDYEQGVRRFYGFNGKIPKGFVYFDPIYESGNVLGYLPNIARSIGDVKQGIYYAIMVEALEQFKKEGIKKVSMGLSPFSFRQDTPINPSVLMERAFRFMFEKCNFMYNYKGLEFSKSRFEGDRLPVYLSHKTKLPVIEVASIFKISKVI